MSLARYLSKLGALLNNSGQVPAAGIADASITQAKLAANVVGNGPAFSAYASSAITLSAGVYTKIALNAETYDTANCFDSTTNYRFTPNVAGYYHIDICLSGGQTASSLTSTIALIYKNGSAFMQGGRQQSTGQPANCSWSGLVYLNGSTDYIEMYAHTNSAAFALSTGVENVAMTRMSGHLVRTA